MLQEVRESWQSSSWHSVSESENDEDDQPTLSDRLDEIVMPVVSFTRVELPQVVASLSAALEKQAASPATGGVNIVLIDPEEARPEVTLTLRNVSLRHVLDFVTASVGYHYLVEDGTVVIRPGAQGAALETSIFPISRATLSRMIAAKVVDPKDGTPSAGTHDAEAIRSFLQQAGIDFETVEGATLAYDGSAAIVTQTVRNLQRIQNLLSRYSTTRQVEIEAKFMEVREGALEELGVNWNIARKLTQHSGVNATYSIQNRSLASAFSHTSSVQEGRIVAPAVPNFVDANGNGVADEGEAPQAGRAAIDLPILNAAPQMPGAADLAAGAGPLAALSGVIGEFDVTAIVRALSQQQGTDLLSAPKVTVLSGHQALMTVAQEMRYPQGFGQTQSQVGTGSASGGGSAGVAITAGTPQEFTTRNVGVELKVTPTVEDDDYSITLDLNPKVTEFDGFVEFGGPSVAISGGTTVTVPSGFYQPIFSVRDISTKVALWDGATLIMGGLTREEVKRVYDKVPVLGSLPLIGRLFRSKGESSQKRNLLIFVTARLVNPSGAPKRERSRVTHGPREAEVQGKPEGT